MIQTQFLVLTVLLGGPGNTTQRVWTSELISGNNTSWTGVLAQGMDLGNGYYAVTLENPANHGNTTNEYGRSNWFCVSLTSKHIAFHFLQASGFYTLGPIVQFPITIVGYSLIHSLTANLVNSTSVIPCNVVYNSTMLLVTIPKLIRSDVYFLSFIVNDNSSTRVIFSSPSFLYNESFRKDLSTTSLAFFRGSLTLNTSFSFFRSYLSINRLEIAFELGAIFNMNASLISIDNVMAAADDSLTLIHFSLPIIDNNSVSALPSINLQAAFVASFEKQLNLHFHDMASLLYTFPLISTVLNVSVSDPYAMCPSSNCHSTNSVPVSASVIFSVCF